MQDRNNSSSRSGGGEGRKPRRSGQSGRTDGNRSRRGKGRGAPQGNRGKGRGAPQGRGSQGRGSQGARGRKPERGHKPAPFKQKTIHLPTTYDVLFYKTLREAEADEPRIRAKAAAVDQFNVVVEAEDLTEDYAFSDVAELYCGAAWTLIHRRRVEDGWYSERGPNTTAETDN